MRFISGHRYVPLDPSRYPQQVCRVLARLLSQGKVDSEGTQWLARHSGGRLPPGWGVVWVERGCSKLEGTPTDQFQLVVTYLRVMEVRCVRCQVRQTGTWRQCHLGWCTHLSARKRGMWRVQCSNHTHSQFRGRRREVLRTEVIGEGDDKRRGGQC